MQDRFNGRGAITPDASSATSASASQSSFLPRRALQLQADEEALKARPAYPTASIANESDPIFEPAASNRSTRGRARAGTLPSSWGDAVPPPQHLAQPIRQPALSRLSPASSQNVDRPAISNIAGLSPAAQGTAPLDPAPFAQDAATSSASPRFRSGSLTMPSANLSNAFGPSFFSSHWQPTRSGLSTMTSAATDEESGSPSVIGDGPGPRFSFDDADMLDYLGLGGAGSNEYDGPLSSAVKQQPESDYGFADSDPYLASANLRNRSSTLGVHQLRPSLNNSGGRARSSSYLPSFSIDTAATVSAPSSQPPSQSATTRSGNVSGSQSPYAGQAPHSSLLNTALHNRLHQYSAAPSAQSSHLDDRVQTNANRPRATSMGVLDHPQSRAPLHSTQPSTHGGQKSSLTSASTASFYNLPPASVGTAPSIDAQADLSAFLAGGRNRAGTIAAFSGPGGRARAEQELVRMAQLYHEATRARDAPTRPSSSAVTEASPTLDVYGPPRPQPQRSVSSSGAQSPFGQGTRPSYTQPTRTLWIGHLRPTARSADLMQIFSRYGQIETVRLVSEKSCAFINYVDTADAIRAREDILGRLGGRVGLGTIGPEGQVRIGFGKPETIPHVGSGGFTPVGDLAGSAIDGAGSEAFGADSANQEASRALWVGSIPPSTSTETLVSIFAPFGPIESIRVLTSKSCAFINYERLEDAMAARKALHGREVLGPEVGTVRIGFAKVPARASDTHFGSLDPGSAEFKAATEALAALSGVRSTDSNLPRSFGDDRSVAGVDGPWRQHLQPTVLGSQSLARNLSTDSARLAPTSSSGRAAGFPTHSASNSIVPSSDKGGVPLPAEMRPKATIDDLQMLMRQLDESDPDAEADAAQIARPRPLVNYLTRIPPVPELPPGRRFDNNRLKEVRRRLETPNCLPSDADAIARDYLPCVVDLSSDFIGNTLVQKFFERCSEPMKKTMLELIAPHLAVIGVHKNGTWAAQKIIDCTHADDQRALIMQHIRAYVPPLLLDQFGNYVVQRLIPFGRPHSDCIFEATVDRCWEIAQGRFGARSMRTCLESPGVAKFYIKQVALAIVLNSVPLATSQNGALLVTWLLDAAMLPGRFRLLAPRFAPHLGNLCTHKLASQTVLRIISQKADPEASRQLLRVLFEGAGRSSLLEEVLVDQVHGSQFVTKIFAEADVLEGAERQRCGEEVKELLIKHGLANMPPYRPLAAEMGLLPTATHSAAQYDPAQAGYDAANLERQLAMMNVGTNPADASTFYGRGTESDFDPWSQSSAPMQDAAFNSFGQQQQPYQAQQQYPPQGFQQRSLHDSRAYY